MKTTKDTNKGGFVTIYEGETPLLNRILDPDDKDPIAIDTADGPIDFEQIAYIPYQHCVYVVMHNLSPIDGIGEDECMVFRYVQDGDEENLLLEDDEEVATAVYDIYISLLED